MYVCCRFWRQMMDRSWMYSIPRASNDFVNVLMFLEFAGEDMRKSGAKKICCLCVIYENDVMYTYESA